MAKRSNKKQRLLVIGRRMPQSGNFGGVVVSFEQLLSQLEQYGLAYDVIDSNQANYKNLLVASVIFWWRFFRHLSDATHISLHANANHVVFLAPVMGFWTKLFNKHFSIRRFAGNFDEQYGQMGGIRQLLVRYALKKADACFFQTYYLVDYFKPLNSATYWMPNSRKRPAQTLVRSGAYRKRFVFLGSVCAEKGLDELLEASRQLGPDYSIAIYGKAAENKYIHLDWSQYPNVDFQGQIQPDDVPVKLAQQDVLVLPTFWRGEGYPGVIIEAMFAGLPVIATGLRGISEMVTDGVEGYLVEPRNVDQLVAAMKRIDEPLFQKMSQAARTRFASFEAGPVTAQYLEQIGMVCS